MRSFPTHQLLTLASAAGIAFVAAGCSSNPTPTVSHSTDPAKIVVPKASSTPTYDDYLQSRMQAALWSHEQTRASRRTALEVLDRAFAPRPEPKPQDDSPKTGRLPPEVIQRIVRQNFGRFRLCYEHGLRNSPNLAGRVSVRFIIGVDGNVTNVGDAGSDMPDSAIVACVVRAFYGLSFPQPEGGIVTVVYPVMFSPGTDTSTPKPPTPTSTTPPAAASQPPPAAPVVTTGGTVPRVGPIVSIDGTTIRVDDQEVGSTKPITELNRVQSVDALVKALKSQREQWQAKHPREPFAGVAGLRAEGSVPLIVFKSVFQSMALAGYTDNFVQLTSDPTNIVELSAHIPPTEPQAPNGAPAHRMHVMLGESDVAVISMNASAVMSEIRVPKPATTVGEKICEEWKSTAVPHDASEDRQEPLVITGDHRAPVSELFQLAQRSETCRRDVQDKTGRARPKPVYWVVFGTR